MKEYVVAFLFTSDMEAVWLIEKQKPEWQKGCLNGIGGKIEEGESPIEAAKREIMEESGLKDADIKELGFMGGTNNDNTGFKVFVFYGKTDSELVTQGQEEIMLIPVEEVKSLKHIENVPALIELCIYKLTGHSNFQSIEMRY